MTKVMPFILVMITLGVGSMRMAAGKENTRELSLGHILGIGPCMDVTLCGAYAYVVGGRCLLIAELTTPGKPTVIGKLDDLGDVRQVAVVGKTAYVTARADGAWIVDVSDPTRPSLLSHYHSVELATGLAVSGPLMCVANRDFGVELIDASNPRAPAHLATVRTGEAQSIDVQGTLLAAGVWGEAKLVLVDIEDPRRPRILAKADLDGYGDGVRLRGRHAYVTTGHHAKAWKTGGSKQGVGGEGYGQGHGFEIFDLSNPTAPRLLSRLKFPAFYRVWPDMWRVVLAGPFAICSDTYNGVFVVDIADPQQPRVVAHASLAPLDKYKLNEPAVGLAVGDGCIYVAGYDTGLHVFGAPELAAHEAPAAHVALGSRWKVASENGQLATEAEVAAAGCRCYQPGGQVNAVAPLGDRAVLAAGQGGLILAELWPTIRHLQQFPTTDIAHHLCAFSNRVFVAEGFAGLSSWEVGTEGRLTRQGQYASERDGRRQNVVQVWVPPPGKYAFLQIGSTGVEILDVSKPAAPVRILEKRLGLMYGDQIGLGLVAQRFLCAYCHDRGIFWFDLEAQPAPACVQEGSTGGMIYRSGLISLGDQVLLTVPGGYKLAARGDREVKSLKTHVIAPGVFGKPAVADGWLFLSDRAEGRVFVVDLRNLEQPRLLKTLTTPGNPGRVTMHHDALLIPDGYGGLRIYDDFFKREGVKP